MRVSMHYIGKFSRAKNITLLGTSIQITFEVSGGMNIYDKSQ